MTDIETIEVTDTLRLRVVIDEGPENPRGWSVLTGYVNIPNRGDSRIIDVLAVYPDEYRIEEAHDRVRRSNPRDGFISTAEVVERWARVFHGMFLEYDSEHGGFWFVEPKLFAENWPDLVLGTQEHLDKQQEVIHSEQVTYQRWADGEVYGVIAERRAEWVRIDNGTVNLNDPRDTIVTWEHAASLWGCYLEDDYTAQQVALDLDVEYTDEELAALRS